MVPLVLTLATVLLAFGLWLRSVRGRAALGFCGAHPVVFLPAVAIWGFVWVLPSVESRALNAPLFKMELPGLSLFPSFCVIIEMVAHIIAASVALAWITSRLWPRTGVTFGAVLGPVAVLLTLAWMAMFGSFIPFSLVAHDAGRDALWVFLAALGIDFIVSYAQRGLPSYSST